MFIITDDPLKDFESWDREQAKQLAKLPLCNICGEPIQQEKAFKLDGEFICDDCIDNLKEYIDVD